MRCVAVALVLFACGGEHDDKPKHPTKLGDTVADWKSDRKTIEPRAADFTIAWRSIKGPVIELGAHVEFGDVGLRPAPTAVKLLLTKNDPQAQLDYDRCTEDDPGSGPFVVWCTIKVNKSDYIAVSIRGDGEIEKDKHTTDGGELFFRK